MNRTILSWSLVGIGACALLIGTDTRDPAAPAEAYAPVVQEHPVTAPLTVRVPDAHLTIVEPLDVTGEAPIICGPGQTLNAAGDGCADLIRYFEDGSWRNLHTGAHGCTPGALCDAPPPAPEIEIVDTPPMEATDRVEFFEDGSWRNHSDGTSGCTPGGLCEDS